MTAANERIAKYADMFSAMGTEPRLRIMQLLLSAHPDGMVVGEIQAELDIPSSTLSHHLDKLRNEELVRVRRESTFLRYTANTDALQELLQFLYAECCTRNKAVKPQDDRSALQIGGSVDDRIEHKDVVKEKYGEAALRVESRRKRLLRSRPTARLAATPSRPIFMIDANRRKFPKKQCWLPWDAEIRPHWRN